MKKWKKILKIIIKMKIQTRIIIHIINLTKLIPYQENVSTIIYHTIMNKIFP